MRFVLLGPLGLADDTGGLKAIGGARLCTLLAALLLHANKPVSTDELADTVWDGAPPSGAATTLRGHVLRLRRSLGPEAGARIVVQDPGYLIRVSDSEVDVLEFQQLSKTAGAAIHASDWDAASSAAAGALALWRGSPLLDVANLALREAWVPLLEQMRLQTLEWRIEADLRRGRRDQLVSELQGLVGEHPLRENFHAQLMRALAGAGRQTEALAAYQAARSALIEELGIEPGPGLREVQERILAGDAEVLGPSRPADGASAQRGAPIAVPRQLPAAIGHFVGREQEVKALTERLPRTLQGGGAVVISAIGGTAGIGKTTLAVYWAQQAALQFPDGQLYVNLRGFDHSHAPMEPAEALRRFLNALGVPPANLPTDLADLAALYRSHLADRRMLILLDNARDAEQVRPLLPGGPGVLVLVTSRDQLGGLIAVDGAEPLTLDLLDEPEARALLIRRLGEERIRSDEAATAELIGLCSGLPLALNVVAARAALRPARALSDLVDELRDSRGRLNALAVGDAAADVRTVFSWSYEALSQEAAYVFRLLGLFPGASFRAHAAAALCDLPLERTERLLRILVNASLLEELSAGRYRFHDLLRAYAAETARQETGERRHDAVRRLVGWYLYASNQARNSLRMYKTPIDIAVYAHSEPALDLPDSASAIAWYDLERTNLLDIAHLARDERHHEIIPPLALCAHGYLERSGWRSEAAAMNELALAAARENGDLPEQARQLTHLGIAYRMLGQGRRSVEFSKQALDLHASLGNVRGQAHCTLLIAGAYKTLENMDEAFRWYKKSVVLYRTVDRPSELAITINNLAYAYVTAERFEEALAPALEAVELSRALHPDVLSAALDTLGSAYLGLGQTDQAVNALREAVAVYAATDDRYGTADALDHYGDALASANRTEEARATWTQAVDWFDVVDSERAAAIRAKLAG